MAEPRASVDRSVRAQMTNKLQRTARMTKENLPSESFSVFRFPVDAELKVAIR